MAETTTNDLESSLRALAQNARQAARQVARATAETRSGVIMQMAKELEAARAAIEEANAQDLSAARERGLSPAMCDRLILSGERIVAASCVFSVSQTEIGDRSMGLRHRAAIGLTEESDAVSIVVSEETGAVSICVDGRIERNMDEDGFRDRLEEIFLSDREGDSDEQDATEEVVPEQLDTQDSVAPGSDRSLVSD